MWRKSCATNQWIRRRFAEPRAFDAAIVESENARANCCGIDAVKLLRLPTRLNILMNPFQPLHDKEVIRWGMIGCGAVTEVKSGPALQKAKNSKLVAVMRRNAALAEDYARRHSVPRWYTDADALISDPAVDAVYIATPPESHVFYANRVANAGKPVYVEKPMARTGAECDHMLDSFAQNKLPLFVAYYRRRLPRFLQVEALIRLGALGTITGIGYRMAAPKHGNQRSWRTDAAHSGGGLLLDVGSHVLDVLDYLFGPLQQVSGVAENRSAAFLVEDSVAVSFLAGGTVPGVASFNFASQVRDETLRISGTLGELTLSVFGNEPIRFETISGVQLFDHPNPPHIQQPLIQSIVDELRGTGNCPSTGESARRTSHVMDQILNAYYGGRHDEFWNRPDTWPGLSRSRNFLSEAKGPE